MRKEIIFAIFAGAIFGIAVAFGLWRAQFFVKEEASTQNPNTNEVSDTSETQTQNLELAITSHEPESVIISSPINLEGLATPNTWVAVSASENTVVKTSEEGVFKTEIDLEDGINRILVTTYDPAGGQKEEESIVLVFSEDFGVNNE